MKLLIPKVLVRVNAIVNPENLDLIAEYLIEKGIFHPEEPDPSIPGEHDARARRLLYEVEGRLMKISSYLSEIQIYSPQASITYKASVKGGWSELAEQEVKSLVGIEERFDKVVDRIRKAREALKELEALKEFLENIKDIDVDLDTLSTLKNLIVEIGIIDVEQADKLSKLASGIEGLLLYSRDISEEKSIVIIIASKALEQSIQHMLREVGFQGLSLPETLPRNPAKAYEEVLERIKKFNEEIMAAKKEIMDNKDMLIEKYSILYTIREALRITATAKRRGNFAFIQGYIPEEFKREFEEVLSKASGGAYIVVYGARSRGVEARRMPTYYRVPKPLRPFHKVVRDFGEPLPNELAPTLFVAFAFPIIYGFMFPDAGHAIAIILFGLYMIHTARGREGRFNTGLLAVYVGISAFIVGFLEGEFFGPLVPFREFVWHGHSPLSPPIELQGGGNVMFMITVSLRTAAVLLITGCLFGVIDCLLVKDYKRAFFEKLPQLIMFASADFPFLIWGASEGGHVIYNAVFGGATLAAAKVVRYGFLTGLVWLFLAEPIYDGMKHGFSEIKSKMTFRLLDVYDMIILVISNTASFMRILGLSLAHAGLMIGFGEMALMAMGGGGMFREVVGIVIYLIGNLFTIGLEGIVVYAHTLRLHYYEWFTKFYTGGGVPFKPAKALARIVFTLA